MVKPQNQRGQGMTEYIIIVGLIAVALIVVVAYFGQRSKTNFAKTGSALAGRQAANGEEDRSRAAASGPGAAPRAAPRSAAGAGTGAGAAPASPASTGGVEAPGEPARPGIVTSGGGKLDANFKPAAPAASPSAYAPEETSPWKTEEIPEEGDTEALVAFAGKMERGSSSSGEQGRSGGVVPPGFPLGTVLLILLVAIGGGFAMVVLMKRG
jgi:Flp pilus assembly pilin Flp